MLEDIPTYLTFRGGWGHGPEDDFSDDVSSLDGDEAAEFENPNSRVTHANQEKSLRRMDYDHSREQTPDSGKRASYHSREQTLDSGRRASYHSREQTLEPRRHNSGEPATADINHRPSRMGNAFRTNEETTRRPNNASSSPSSPAECGTQMVCRSSYIGEQHQPGSHRENGLSDMYSISLNDSGHQRGTTLGDAARQQSMARTGYGANSKDFPPGQSIAERLRHAKTAYGQHSESIRPVPDIAADNKEKKPKPRFGIAGLRSLRKHRTSTTDIADDKKETESKQVVGRLRSRVQQRRNSTTDFRDDDMQKAMQCFDLHDKGYLKPVVNDTNNNVNTVDGITREVFELPIHPPRRRQETRSSMHADHSRSLQTQQRFTGHQ